MEEKKSPLKKLTSCAGFCVDVQYKQKICMLQPKNWCCAATAHRAKLVGRVTLFASCFLLCSRESLFGVWNLIEGKDSLRGMSQSPGGGWLGMSREEFA